MSAVRLLGIAHASTTAAKTMIIGPLAAVLDDPEAVPLPDGVHRHHHLIVAQCRLGPFLPAPFGLVLRAAEELQGCVDSARDTLLRDLDRYAGMVEWSVRLEPRQASVPLDLTPGRAFLAERQTAAAMVADARDLTARFNAFAPEPPVTGLLADATEDGLVRITLLVPAGTHRPVVEAAWAGIASSVTGDPTVATRRPVGPWPPYRFVALGRHFKAKAALAEGAALDDNAA